MFKIKLRVSNSFTAAQCVLCWRVFKHGGVEALLYEDMRVLGGICKACMEEGSKNLSSLLRTHAQRFGEWARELEKMAHEDIAFPTDEEYECAKKEREDFEHEMLQSFMDEWDGESLDEEETPF